MHDNEIHEALLVSKIVELKRDLLTEKQKKERSDVRNKQLEVQLAEMRSEMSFLSEKINNFSRKYELVEPLQKRAAKLEDQLSQPRFQGMGGVRLKKDINLLNSKVINIED